MASSPQFLAFMSAIRARVPEIEQLLSRVEKLERLDTSEQNKNDLDLRFLIPEEVAAEAIHRVRIPLDDDDLPEAEAIRLRSSLIPDLPVWWEWVGPSGVVGSTDSTRGI
jgi:hypothetical protein